jgi:hypothetical protein
MMSGTQQRESRVIAAVIARREDVPFYTRHLMLWVMTVMPDLIDSGRGNSVAWFVLRSCHGGVLRMKNGAPLDWLFRVGFTRSVD